MEGREMRRAFGIAGFVGGAGVVLALHACGGRASMHTTADAALADAGSPVDGGTPSDATLAMETATASDAAPEDTGAVDAASSVCPSGRGPDMVLLPFYDAGLSYCIDTTEVTVAQYAQFLADDAGISQGLPAGCDRDASRALPALASFGDASACDGYLLDPAGRGDYPVTCLDWCDAYAFCRWAGKTLCGDAHGNAWTTSLALLGPIYGATDCVMIGACTANGQFAQPGVDAGVVVDQGASSDPCNEPFVLPGKDAGLAPVHAHPGCTEPVPGFDQAGNLQGNAAEFTDGVGCPSDGASCQSSFGGSWRYPGQSCGFGGGYASQLATAPDPRGDIDLGFRCCFTP
jgi:hypothetical protein